VAIDDRALENVSRTIAIVGSPKGDYYTKDVGTWRGKGAEILGLKSEGRGRIL
jgi:hypothetical protein